MDIINSVAQSLPIHRNANGLLNSMENAKDHALLGTLRLDQAQNTVTELLSDKLRLYATHMTIPIKLLDRLLYTEPVYGHNGRHAILDLVRLDFRV